MKMRKKEVRKIIEFEKKKLLKPKSGDCRFWGDRIRRIRRCGLCLDQIRRLQRRFRRY